MCKARTLYISLRELAIAFFVGAIANLVSRRLFYYITVSFWVFVGI